VRGFLLRGASTKDPRNREPVPRTQGRKRLLATEHPIVVVPAAVEPVPVPHPAAVTPVDVVDVAGDVGVTPVGEDKHDLAPQGDWDVLLVVQKILPIVLAKVGDHLLGPLDHGVADHRLLVFM